MKKIGLRYLHTHLLTASLLTNPPTVSRQPPHWKQKKKARGTSYPCPASPIHTYLSCQPQPMTRLTSNTASKCDLRLGSPSLRRSLTGTAARAQTRTWTCTSETSKATERLISDPMPMRASHRAPSSRIAVASQFWQNFEAVQAQAQARAKSFIHPFIHP